MSCSCWDEKFVEDFLNEYRRYELLWNPFHRQFHDCLAKGEALKKLVKNLRLGFGVQDCLKLLKSIREKYIEDQTKTLLTVRENLCQPQWMRIVDSMLEKIVGDEACKSNYLAPIRCDKSEPAVKVLFRHTITSKKRNCIAYPKQRKRGKNKRKRQRGKLEKRGRCCGDNAAVAERDMDPCRPAQDCSRSQSNWCKQRDDYLDKLTNCSNWTKPCPKPIECPGLASHIERCSRIENVGKDPCASTPVYMCPNRDTHVNCNFNNHGRRRATDIYPTITEPRSCRSPPRPTTCPPPRKPSPPRCPPKKEKPICCPPPPEDKCATDKKPNSADACTRDTCPSYIKPKCPETKICEIIKPECPDRNNVRFDSSCSPRVAARFENGVLEAYSQFKVVFPSSSTSQDCQESKKKKCCTQKVQTDSTTRECAVGVSSREFLRGRRNSSSREKCGRKKNVGCGTEEDFVECCPENDVEENNNPCADYVLLTPGGKYVPLVKTKLEVKEEDECTCAAESSKRQENNCCEMRREPSPPRTCEKSSLDDEKCPSTTTKLLLRCLEHMLNLEEQQQCSTIAKTNDDGSCEPCRRKEQQRRELAAAQSSSCLPCQEDRLNNNNNSPRGKLTQNFLEILKCAMELDCNNNNKTNNEDCCQQEVTDKLCRCVDNDVDDEVIASSTKKGNECVNSTMMKDDVDDECKRRCSDKMVQRKVSVRETATGGNCFGGEGMKTKGTQDGVERVEKGVQSEGRRSRDKQGKRDTVLDNLVRCNNWPEYKTARNLSVALKCDDNPEPNITRVPATTLPPSRSPPPQHRDQTLQCLREELQRDKEYFDKGKMSYVKCNQVYRSYVVRSPQNGRNGNNGSCSPTRERAGCYSYR